MRRERLVALVAGVTAWLVAGPVSAQTFASVGRIEVSGGVGWTGEQTLERREATLVTSQGSQGTGLTLFATDSRIGGAASGRVRLGVRLGAGLEAEGGFALSHPRFETRILRDAEGADSVTASNRLDRYIIEAGVVWHLDRFAFANRRAVPFISCGGGYLRELDEASTVVETGSVWAFGGGLKWAILERRGGVKTVGIRADLRGLWRSGGFDTSSESSTRGSADAAASLFVRF